MEIQDFLFYVFQIHGVLNSDLVRILCSSIPDSNSFQTGLGDEAGMEIIIVGGREG